jgi:glycosyltransferase involved in cell wall biosynthesis
MTIAYLVSEYPAPSHTFIRREVHALRARGIDIRTFTVRRTPRNQLLSDVERQECEATEWILPLRPARLVQAHFWAVLTRPGAYLRTVRAALRHRVPGLRGLAWSVFHFAEAVQLARALKKARVTHLHNHFANAGANVGYLASRFLDLPWSLTLHGTAEFDYPAGVLLGEKLRAARFAACVSDFGRAQAMRTVGPGCWSKLLLVRCGVEVAALPARARPANGAVRFVCVGRLSPEKGQVGLVEAFGELPPEGLNAELRLVGDGPDAELVRERIERLGVAKRCTLLGRLGEAEALQEIADADVLVLSSLMEGLPVVIAEALALRVPVIAPCVAGIPELVRHGENGLLYRPGRWDEMAECMRRLAADATLRQALGAAGRDRVLGEFDAAKAIEPLVERFSA